MVQYCLSLDTLENDDEGRWCILPGTAKRISPRGQM